MATDKENEVSQTDMGEEKEKKKRANTHFLNMLAYLSEEELTKERKMKHIQV